METINQQPQTETLNVTTILDSNITRDSPQTIEDVKNENSTSVQHNTNEHNDLQDETLTSTTTEVDSKNETTDIQLPIEDKADYSNNNEREEEPMDISRDSGDEYHVIRNDNEAQQVEMPVEQQQPQTEPHDNDVVEDSGHNNTIKYNESDEITSSEAKKCKYDDDDKCKETEEDELLKSDNEDNIDDKQQKDKTVSDTISMEREEELLKSEDEEELLEIHNEATGEERRDSKDCKAQVETGVELKSLQNTNEECNTLSLEKQLNEETHKDENNDIKLREEQTGQSKLDIDVVNPYDDDNRSSKGSSSPSNSSKVQANKKRSNAENHRILYQFDLDEDTSSLDSLDSRKSPIFTHEKQTESIHEKSPYNPTHEMETQQTISETADINDVENDVNKVTQLEEDREHLTEAMKAHFSPHEVCPSDNELHLIGKIPKNVDNISNRKVNLQEEQENIKSPWNSLHSNSYSSKENLNIEEKHSHGENLEDEQLSDFNDDHADDNNFHDQDQIEERNSIELPKLNGNHDSRDQYSEAEQNENTTIDNINNNDDSNLIKLRRLSLESNARTPTPQHSPLSLPQNEEAQAEFENTQDNREHKKEFKCDNESDLKINERNCEDFRQDNNENKELISSPPPPPQLTTQNEDDEVSRSSIASSASYSSTTSSSQHLVIDHPMDDLKEEKIKPLKITLKRKLSNLSDDFDSLGPPQKQPHLNNEKAENEEFHETLNFSNEEQQHEQERVNDLPKQDQSHMDINESLLMQHNSEEAVLTQDKILNSVSNNKMVI